jgi:hypothetical protein
MGLRSKRHGQTLRPLGINDLRHIYLTQTIVVATITREEPGKIAWSMMQSPGSVGVCAYWSTDIRELNLTIFYRAGHQRITWKRAPASNAWYSTTWTDIFPSTEPSLLEDAFAVCSSMI